MKSAIYKVKRKEGIRIFRSTCANYKSLSDFGMEVFNTIRLLSGAKARDREAEFFFYLSIMLLNCKDEREVCHKITRDTNWEVSAIILDHDTKLFTFI